MKHALDVVPLAAMAVAWGVTHDLYAATIALMISLPVTALAYRWSSGRWHMGHTLGAVAAVLLGSLTLYFHDGVFIKAKLSIVCVAMALAFLGSQFIGRQTLIQRMLGDSLQLPDFMWRRVNLAWAGFNLFCAALNWYIASNYDDGVWIQFKTIGVWVLTLIFVAAHGPFLMRYLQEPQEEPAPGDR